MAVLGMGIGIEMSGAKEKEAGLYRKEIGIEG